MTRMPRLLDAALQVFAASGVKLTVHQGFGQVDHCDVAAANLQAACGLKTEEATTDER